MQFRNYVTEQKKSGRKEKNSDINTAEQLGNGFFFNIVIAGIVSAPTHERIKAIITPENFFFFRHYFEDFANLTSILLSFL